MKHKFVYVALFVALFVCRSFAQSSGWELYEPRTLKEITTTIIAKSLENPDVLIRYEKEDVSTILSYNSFQSRVKVIYSGTSRKTPEQTKKVISLWLTTVGKPKEYADMFEDEYLFAENNVEYWLPVQKQVAAYFGTELKKGDAVTLYVVWLGARKEAKSIDYIFLVNEFEAVKSP